MSKIKTKRIAVRVDESLYEFLKEFSSQNNLDISKLVRNILIYFHVGFMVGEFQTDIDTLKTKWQKIYQTDKTKFKIKGVDKILGK